MSEFAPEAFGKYYLVDKVAVGGMAEIFKAKTFSHGGFENLVVIKRILQHLGERDDFVDMFIDEAKVSVSLQHENIVRIYDFGKLGDNYFIAMECVEGKDIRGILRKLAHAGRRLPPEYAAYLIHEAAKGLEYAHRKTDRAGKPMGIIHRDISPSNILASYEGVVKVADFGIAKAEMNARETQDGVLKGKFEYMSPEQIRGFELDQRADLFSLGTVFWEMLTVARLFKTGSDVATLEKIRSGNYPSPCDVEKTVPRAIEPIVMRLLEPDRDKRYQTAGELQADLARFLAPQTVEELRQGFTAWMQRLFAEEIAEESARLEAGSEVARRQREAAEAAGEAWPETQSTSTIRPSQPAAVLPWILVGGLPLVLLLLLMVLMSAGGLIWYSQLPEAPVAVSGAELVIQARPSARIEIDGEEQGFSDFVRIRDLDPGRHVIRATAPGYLPDEREVLLEPGDSLPVTLILQREAPVAVEEPKEEPTPVGNNTPAAFAKVVFQTSPSGATVLVDGRPVGETPVTWTKAKAQKSYALSFQLEGYDIVRTTFVAPQGGQSETVRRELREIPKAPGKLSVALVGGGWANVYVDGAKLGKPAPLSGHPLSAGPHKVRVENEALGLDQTQEITVEPDKTTTVRVNP